MPAYNKKITRPMEYTELKEGIADLPDDKQALLTLIFFAGCRISEALALTSDDIDCRDDMMYVKFFRLKNSKQTDPQEIPRIPWLCEQHGKIFHFTRQTAWRWVKKGFGDLYPHYFRLNRFTKSLERFGAVVVVNTYGVSMITIQNYVGKVDIKRVGKALLEELG